MEQYALYLVLKDIINSLGYNFSISFNDIDINGDEVIGILIKSGSNPKYRELKTGEYAGYSNRVQILVQSSYDKGSLFSTLNLTEKIRDVLTSDVNNNIYKLRSLRYIGNKLSEVKNNSTEGEEVSLGISSTHLVGDVDFKGKTSQTRSIYSLNLLINYYITLGGN